MPFRFEQVSKESHMNRRVSLDMSLYLQATVHFDKYLQLQYYQQEISKRTGTLVFCKTSCLSLEPNMFSCCKISQTPDIILSVQNTCTRAVFPYSSYIIVNNGCVEENYSTSTRLSNIHTGVDD
jgi:hypothetical protein